MTTLTSFTFVRHIDGLRYTFERDGQRNGRPAYRRTDGNVWCVWSPADGWHCEIADGLVTAHPLNSHTDEPDPPATVWRSFKNDPSLRHTEHAVLRVRKPHLYGTSGTLYRLTDHGWHASETDT